MHLRVMKKSKIPSLLFFLLAFTTSAQELITKAPKEHRWSALYFTFYDPEILLNHSIGCGFGTKDVRLSTGFSFGKNLLGAKYNYSTDSRNYLNSGDYYGAFLKPEADIVHIGKRFKLSGTCLLNYSYWKFGFSFQGQDSSGAPAGNEYFQKTNNLDFFYGLNAEITVYKNISLGAGVLMKFFSCYAGKVSITDFSTNTSSSFNFGYNGPNDSYNRWFYPSAFIRYDLSFQR